MKKLFIVLALLGGICSCYAATPVDAQLPTPPFKNYHDAILAGAMKAFSKKYEEARTDYIAALALAKTDKEKTDVLAPIGQIFFEQKDYAQARKYFDEFLAIDKNDPGAEFEVLDSYAQSYSNEGKYHEARVIYNKALGLKGVEPRRLFYMQADKADTFLSEKQYPEARKEYEKLRLYRKNFSVAADVLTDVCIGESYLVQGNPKAARAHFLKSLAYKEKVIKSKNDAQQFNSFLFGIYQYKARFDIAESYVKEKHYDKAKDEYLKIIRMDDSDFLGAYKKEAKKKLQQIEELQKRK
jgi:tetratricopeptide (TPR) repeat protein